jgi:hypothetical protein
MHHHKELVPDALLPGMYALLTQSVFVTTHFKADAISECYCAIYRLTVITIYTKCAS